jgi:hypothetical protein
VYHRAEPLNRIQNKTKVNSCGCRMMAGTIKVK